MLSESIIVSARQIKNEFKNLNSSLSHYENEIKSLANLFFTVSDELGVISEKASKKNMSIDDIKRNVLEQLSSLEDETNKISNKIKSVNEKIEKLKKEELDLYHLIKKRYPSLTDEEIRIELQRRI